MIERIQPIGYAAEEIYCSKPGTKVTSIKTPEYTKFFVEFEIPR